MPRKADHLLGVDVGASFTRIVRLSGELTTSVIPTLGPGEFRLADALLEPPSTAFFSLAAEIEEDWKVRSWPNRPDWRGSHLLSPPEKLAKHILGWEDDGLCAAEFEIALRGITNASAVCSIGTGLGLAICRQGDFLAARGGASLGHRIFADGGRLCTCGQFGCLQTVLNRDALIEPGVSDMEIASALKFIADDLCGTPKAKLIFTGGSVSDQRLRNRLSAICKTVELNASFSAVPFWAAAAGALLRASNLVERGLTAAQITRMLSSS